MMVLEFEIGDIVETDYVCITNTIGKIIDIHNTTVTIIGMEGEVSHHKKDRLTIVTND